MRILIWYMYSKQHGGGHKYRCMAIRRKAIELGHIAELLTNDPTVGKHHHMPEPMQEWSLNTALRISKPDWLIVDLESYPPLWLKHVCDVHKVKIANINANGWAMDNGLDADQSWANMIWVQDSPETIILRRSVLDSVWKPGDKWFVFGGSADPLGLLPRFDETVTDDAYLVGTDLMDGFTPIEPKHKFIKSVGDEILKYMTTCEAACTHMGIVNFELAAISNGKMPQFIISRSEGHLYYARNMERLGYAKAYPGVGLPSSEELFAFIDDISFKPDGPSIDGKGAERLIRAMQKG